MDLRHNYAHIFDLLTSLRRAVDHPYLIVFGGGQAFSHALARFLELGESQAAQREVTGCGERGQCVRPLSGEVLSSLLWRNGRMMWWRMERR